MYPKSRNDLTWTCCGEDVEEKTKGLAVKNPVLLRVNRGSETTERQEMAADIRQALIRFIDNLRLYMYKY